MKDVVILTLCGLGALFLVIHLRAVLQVLLTMCGYAVLAGLAWLAISALWKWPAPPTARKAQRESFRTTPAPAGTAAGEGRATAAAQGYGPRSVATSTDAPAGGTGTPAGRITVLRRPRRLEAPETANDGRGELVVIGPQLGKLAERLDPLTRTPFASGEQAVRCGACGRLYKVNSCRALHYACPVDRASLRVRGS